MDELKRNEQQSDGNQDVQQAPAPIKGVAAAVNNPTGCDHSNHKKTNWPQRIEAVCAVLLVLITGTYTYYSAGQLHKMRRATKAAEDANVVAREALVAVQRAFVDAKGTGAKRFVNRGPDGANWVFEEDFVNDGTTPALQVIQRSGVDELPNGITEDVFIGSQDDINITKKSAVTIGTKTPYILGPFRKSDAFVLSGQTFNMNPSAHTPAVEITRHVYSWAWLIYRDVFPDTPLHLTEVCEELNTITVNSKEQTTNVYFRNCDSHNCTDTYCEDYQRLIDAVFPPPKPKI